MKRYRDEGWLREKYHGERWTLQDMADECGVTIGTVHRWMKRHGVKRRDRKQYLRREYAGFYNQQSGYEAWSSHNTEGTTDHLRVHRLLAVAKYGFDAVCGKQVHHKNGIRWDNRPENIEIVTRDQHREAHDEFADAPWRDEQTLIDAYAFGSLNDLAAWWGCDQRTILT